MASLRIGTRGSPLALWQANHVAERLREAHPGLHVELVEIQTVGDQVRDRPLAQIGGEGVFTKAIQDAVLERRADVAVHSLKDLPTVPIAGLVLASVPARAATGDVLVSSRFGSFADLPTGAILATSSVRRRAQVLHRRPDLKLVDIRGNVETRLNKLDTGTLDGLILAQAGLERLGFAGRITEVLDQAWMLPAVGQGALALECRSDDPSTRELLANLDHRPTHQAVLAERALLRGLGGGCQMPLGCLTTISENQLTVRGAVLTPSGAERLEQAISGPLVQGETLGQDLAQLLLRQGAARLLGTTK